MGKKTAEIGQDVHELSKILNQECNIVNAIIAATVGHESVKQLCGDFKGVPEKVSMVLPLLLQAVGSSCNTLIKLSDKPGMHTRDCYSIARSIIELSSNISFIISQGSDVADRAMRHAKQKSFRDLNRESNIKNSKIVLSLCGADKIEPDDVTEYLNEFTSNSNREKNWTDTTIDQRIEIAGNKLGGKVLTYLHMSRFLIYRHSSEIIHGSFFGTLFFFGMTSPPATRSVEDLEKNFRDHHVIILLSVILSLAAVVESFHYAYNFKWAFIQTNRLLKSLNDISSLLCPNGLEQQNT